MIDIASKLQDNHTTSNPCFNGMMLENTWVYIASIHFES